MTFVCPGATSHFSCVIVFSFAIYRV